MIDHTALVMLLQRPSATARWAWRPSQMAVLCPSVSFREGWPPRPCVVHHTAALDLVILMRQQLNGLPATCLKEPCQTSSCKHHAVGRYYPALTSVGAFVVFIK